MEISDGGNIIKTNDGIKAITGFSEHLVDEFLFFPLFDTQRQRGTPAISTHWRPQFAFSIQGIPDPSLAETLYYIDYQGVRYLTRFQRQTRK